jgi:hypothetical protein
LDNGQPLLLILLSHGYAVVANAEPLFDQTKRAVLPSEAATTILKWYVPDRAWITSEWGVSSEALDPLEVALAAGLAKAGVSQTSFKIRDFYRQHMPARWKKLHLIVVNGFYESASDMFSDKGIDPEQWKHELLTAFGGRSI